MANVSYINKFPEKDNCYIKNTLHKTHKDAIEYLKKCIKEDITEYLGGLTKEEYEKSNLKHCFVLSNEVFSPEYGYLFEINLDFPDEDIPKIHKEFIIDKIGLILTPWTYSIEEHKNPHNQ